MPNDASATPQATYRYNSNMPRFLTNFLVRLWGRSFLRHCARQAKGRLQNPSQSLAALRRRHRQLMIAPGAALPDHKAVMIRTMCSWVLAAFQTLRLELDDAAAFEIVRRSFARTFRLGVRLQIGLLLRFTRDPVAFLSRRSLAAMAQRRYGASMDFAQETTADSVDLLVRRCSFHQFFVDHGVPELTSIVCAWDRNWMDLFDRSSRPIRTERPTTISTGGDCCRFRFVRTIEKQPAAASDVIELQLTSESNPLSVAK